MKGDFVLKIIDHEKIYQQIRAVEAIHTASEYKGNIFPNYSEILQNRINMPYQVEELQLRAMQVSQTPLIRSINLLQAKTILIS